MVPVPADSLKEIAFFSTLEERERELLGSISHRRRYGKGEEMFAEGAATGPLRVLVDGLVSFRQHQQEGGEALMSSASEVGAIFGISALMGKEHVCPYTAVCLEDTEVIEIDGAELMTLCEKQPDVGVQILRHLTEVLAARLAGAREQIRSRIRPGLISHG